MKKFLFIFLLSLFACGSGTVFAEVNQNNHVSSEKALKYAEKFIVKELRVVPDNLKIEYDIYDIDESVLGYYITYSKNGKSNNIIISATKERMPIIEFGEGTIETSTNKNDKLFYLGALNYWFAPNKETLESQYEEQRKTKVDNLMSNLSKDKIKLSKESQIEIEQTIKILKNEKIQSFGKGNFENEWKSLESVNSENDKNFLPATNRIKTLGVSRVWQRMTGEEHPDSACGPASGVMVANYMKSQGYNIRDSAYYGQSYKFINHLWNEMSWYIGASMASYRDEMEDHLNINYSFTHKFDVVSWTLASNSFWQYEGWIDAGLPVTIRFNNMTQGKYWSDWHFVVGAAYQVTSSGEFIGVKNPDNGQTNTGFNYFPFIPNYETISFAKIDINN